MSEIAFIETFLREIQPYVREKYADRSGVAVSSKDDHTDLLTEVDLSIQKRFVEQAGDRFPGDLIVGEEGEYARYPEDPEARAWLIDPIDGTYNFVRGLFPVFGVSIAFARGNTAVAGGVLLPITGDLFLAEQGGGASRNGRRIKVSNIHRLEEACLDVDFSGPHERMDLFRRAESLFGKTGQLRCRGAAVVSLCSVATADTEAYLHAGLTPWDFAAGEIIVKEAGGVSSRLEGSPIRLFDPCAGILMSNGALHQNILDNLQP
jgi:myo-inositol-1(or 4)-monophosphatase